MPRNKKKNNNSTTTAQHNKHTNQHNKEQQDQTKTHHTQTTRHTRPKLAIYHYIYMVVIAHERSFKMLPLVPCKHMLPTARSQYLNADATYMREAMKMELIANMGTPDDDFSPVIAPRLTLNKQDVYK